MDRFIWVCRGLTCLGVLGLPGLFLPQRFWDFMLLFFLFGFVEIFSNFPVFVQSVKQICGMVYVPLKYGKGLPDKDNYRSKADYSLPFRDAWVVVNGGVTKKSSHSWGVHSQRYAYDFLIIDENGKSFDGEKTDVNSYYCYGREILAPADGIVAEVHGGERESSISKYNLPNCAAKDICGNHILIDHGDEEYSLLAHLQPEGILVKAGDSVKRGQPLARCGNSGNTSEPHLHFQLQKGKSFFCSPGLPITFTGVSATDAPNYAAYDPRALAPVAEYPEPYIHRGQLVTGQSL